MTPRRDALWIYVVALLRSACVGFVGVVLAIYLRQNGLSVVAAGVVIGVGLGGAAVATLIMSFGGDRFGRRRTLLVLTALTAIGYAALALSTRLVVLLPLALVGMLNGMGRDRGAAVALEQAVLPETADAAGRTWVLAWHNVVLDVGHALGALAGAAPTLLSSSLGITDGAAHRVLFLVCAGASLVSLAPYAALSRRIEMAKLPSGRRKVAGSDRTRAKVWRLAGLFGVDSLGGGFLSSALLAYWFFERFGISESALGIIFFAARLLNAGGHLAAAWMASRLGLLKTMVFTHLPSSLFLMAAPLAPSGGLAVALFLTREALVEMDVPTRQSYVMAIVRPRERTFASGVTNVTRNVAWAVGPSLAGVVMQHIALAAPLFIGGTLKIGYDLTLYGSFRHVKPPEERRGRGP